MNKMNYDVIVYAGSGRAEKSCGVGERHFSHYFSSFLSEGAAVAGKARGLGKVLELAEIP
jgi:hypothetical protein